MGREKEGKAVREKKRRLSSSTSPFSFAARQEKKEGGKRGKKDDFLCRRGEEKKEKKRSVVVPDHLSLLQPFYPSDEKEGKSIQKKGGRNQETAVVLHLLNNFSKKGERKGPSHDVGKGERKEIEHVMSCVTLHHHLRVVVPPKRGKPLTWKKGREGSPCRPSSCPSPGRKNG